MGWSLRFWRPSFPIKTHSLALAAPPETFGSAPSQKERWPTWTGSMHLNSASQLEHSKQCQASYWNASGVGAIEVLLTNIK